MSEIAPRSVRGALVSGYQFCITLGILIASCVTYATTNREDAGSYRIPIALQLLWAIILSGGLLFLPESPRYYINKGDNASARRSLARVRGQPEGSKYILDELAEIEANLRHELSLRPKGGYFQTWFSCFQGSLWQPSSNLRRTILGTSLQMMQQWTGVNFVFYFGTPFFKSLGTVKNPFLTSLVLALVNVLSTPISFFTIEKFGRRPLLIWGAAGMIVCQFLVAIIGTATDQNPSAIIAMISFLCIYIFFFASTWGPGAWVVIGEIFPLPIRARGVGLSTASNWLWNYVSWSCAPPSLTWRRSSHSSRPTWLIPRREIWAPKYSSCGVRCAAAASSMPTSSCTRPRA
jgi:sugar porter (SP) family MFS transporter